MGKAPPWLLLNPLWSSHKSNKSLPGLMLPFLSGLSYVFQFATAVINTQLGIFQVKIVLLVCQTRQYFSLWHTHWKRCWAGAVTLPIAVQCWTLCLITSDRLLMKFNLPNLHTWHMATFQAPLTSLRRISCLFRLKTDMRYPWRPQKAQKSF